MTESKYPNKIMGSFTDHTYEFICILSDRDERTRTQQVRWYVNLGIWVEICKVVLNLMSMPAGGLKNE